MRDAFITEQVESLDGLDYVVLGVPLEAGSGMVEVERTEDGATYRVMAAGDPALPDTVVSKLAKLGLNAGPLPVAERPSPTEAAALAEAVLTEAFAVPDGARIDVRHGSRKEEVARQRKLDALRSRVQAVMQRELEAGSWSVDDDGDVTFAVGSARVFVGPRLSGDGTAAVLVFAATSVGIEPTPELGLFLAETNFHLAFGRFALDAEHGVVWFGHNLYGESFTDEELAFMVKVVGATANQFDERIVATFGGQLAGSTAPPTAPDQESLRTKPGSAGYL